MCCVIEDVSHTIDIYANACETTNKGHVMIDLNELPDNVRAYDEDLFERVLERVCADMNLDPYYANSSYILDEYHDCPAYENYPDHVTVDNDGPDVMIPSSAMIDFARDELTTLRDDPELNEDVRKSIALRDDLAAMSSDEIDARLRAFLDEFIPADMTPYTIEPKTPVYYRVMHDNRIVGHVQFNNDAHDIAVPLTNDDHRLYNARQIHLNLPTYDY